VWTIRSNRFMNSQKCPQSSASSSVNLNTRPLNLSSQVKIGTTRIHALDRRQAWTTQDSNRQFTTCPNRISQALALPWFRSYYCCAGRMKRKRTPTIAILAMMFLAAPAPKPQARQSNPTSRVEFAGDEVCARCHEEKAASYDRTAHHLTSQAVSKASIAGSFAPGLNIMATSNPDLSFLMEHKGGAFFQTAIWGSPPNQRIHTERFDLVIGSGRNGQTYLFWDENQLFQLPVGYSNVRGRWINSPGYPDGTASFSRGIVPRCLECHTAYFEPQFPDPASNFYNTRNFVIGISCEKMSWPRPRARGTF
jgi:hypothetical protein